MANSSLEATSETNGSLIEGAHTEMVESQTLVTSDAMDRLLYEERKELLLFNLIASFSS